MRSSDRGQIYTMEGITAAIILLGVLFFVIEANSVVSPQTEKVLDMKLGRMASDVITSIDLNDANSWSTSGSLKSYVAGWDGTVVSYTNNVPEAGMVKLNRNLQPMFPNDVKYNLEFIYWNKTGKHSDMVLINGEPGDNSMVASRMVTLNDFDSLTPFWRSGSTFPQVVEVRLTCWYL